MHNTRHGTTRHNTTKIRNDSISKKSCRAVSCRAVAVCIDYATCVVSIFLSCRVVSCAVCKGLNKRTNGESVLWVTGCTI
jgi:hypothetical protein